MGIGESLLYQSEFSAIAETNLRKILEDRFDAQLLAELSSIRYAVSVLHSGRPPKALSAPQRVKITALRKDSERLAKVVQSLSKSWRSTPATEADSPLTENTRLAVAFAVQTALSRSGRFNEFMRRVEERPEPGKLKVLRVRNVPDFFTSLASEIGLLAESLRALEKAPLAAGRPPNLARDHAAVSVAETLKRWKIPITKTRDGLFARVLEIVLLEFDLEAPEDFARLVRLSIDRAKDPDWVRNLVGKAEVSPLLDD